MSERSPRGRWPVSPDCHAGKHTACTGDAWDLEEDRPTACDCACHDPGGWHSYGVDIRAGSQTVYIDGKAQNPYPAGTFAANWWQLCQEVAALKRELKAELRLEQIALWLAKHLPAWRRR